MTVFLGWFFSVYFAVCITYPKHMFKLLHKIWLWRSDKIARDNTITAVKLINWSKAEDVTMVYCQLVNAKYTRPNVVNTLAWCGFAVPSIPNSSTHTVKFIGNAIQQFWCSDCEYGCQMAGILLLV